MSLLSYEQFEAPETLQKYLNGGGILSKTINHLLPRCLPGTSVMELLQEGDSFLMKELGKQKFENEICFPLGIARNEICGNYRSTDPQEQIQEGDLVKIELGVAIDGYPTCLAYTHLVNTQEPLPKDDPRSRVLRAVVESSREALGVIAPGNTNTQLVQKLHQLAEKHDCRLLGADMMYPHAPGVISYQMSRQVIDGKNEDEEEDVHKLILVRRNETFDFELRETEFEENEVYGIDVAFSSGTGKTQPSEPVTLFKRNPDTYYALRMKTSRETLKKIGTSSFPRDCSGMRDARFKMGLTECLKHDVIEAYPPMTEKAGEFVGRVKFTVVVRKKTKNNRKGHVLLAGRPAQEELSKIES